MSEHERTPDELAAQAALAAGRQYAERAVHGLVSSEVDEDDSDATPEAPTKRRRFKLVAFGVVALLIVLGALGMVVSYWHWFLLAGVLGAVGLYGWYRVRKRLKAGQRNQLHAEVGSRTQGEARAARAEETEPAHRVDAEASGPSHAAALRQAQEQRARARREAAAAEEQGIDEEIEAMKARLGK